MRRILPILAVLVLLPVLRAQDGTYFPPRGSWERRAPADAGFDPARLAEAVRFAIASENPASRDLPAWVPATLGNEPYGDVVGPVRPRGDTCGLIVHEGRIVAEWGPVDRVDMTFSVTKTFLSTVTGLLFDDGLVRSVDEPVHRAVPGDLFPTDAHRRITWDHLLRQTSDWRGTLFGKPAWADRPPRGASLEEMKAVPPSLPGERWEYNDVRVNLLALCALHVLREPLPRVLRHRIMDPIGASRSWQWHGYESSWVTVDGARVQSVSGGGHWGGGMFISATDLARFGYLFLNDGRWQERQLISEEWIRAARTPTKARPSYGYMNWFLNGPRRRGRRALPSAPEEAVTFRGAGSNIVYVDRINSLVIVARWIRTPRMDGIVRRVLDARKR